MKVPGTEDILINPLGLQYYEITASKLAKITLDGKILDRGSTQYGVNRAGYILHTAIHEVRPDIYCTLHMHNTAIAAVSSMKCGLLPINQEAMIIGPKAYMDYTVSETGLIMIVCREFSKMRRKRRFLRRRLRTLNARYDSICFCMRV